MSLLARLLLVLLHGYQRVAAHLPARCRFYPTCSAYAVEAIGVHGALRGSFLAARRLLRCGPWHPGGLDPVPQRRPGRDRRARSTEEQAPC